MTDRTTDRLDPAITDARGVLELDIGALDADEIARYDATARTLLEGTGHYRRAYRAPRSRPGDDAPGPPDELGPEPLGIEEQQPAPS